VSTHADTSQSFNREHELAELHYAAYTRGSSAARTALRRKLIRNAKSYAESVFQEFMRDEIQRDAVGGRCIG